MDDQDLNRLLREWRAPDTPPGLDPRRTRPSWRWLVTGTIRVPVPAALAVLVLIGTWMGVTRLGPLATQTPVRPAPPGASLPEAPSSGTAVPRPSGELARYALSGSLEGFEAVLVELNFPPGFRAPEHRHPGFILGYVVDGQMRFGINHEPDRIVPAGGVFFEPSGALHTTFGAASADAPVRLLVFLVVPTGSPLTGPA